MVVKNRLPEESSLQRGAFRLYWDLGDKRSYAAVAKALDVSLSTIKGWARKFRWQERLKTWAQWRSFHKPKRNPDPRLKQVEDAIRALDAAIVRVLQRLIDGDLNASTKDVLHLHRLEQRILGMLNGSSDASQGGRRTVVLLPDNGRDLNEGDRPFIPESLVGDYIDFLDSGI